MTDKPTTASIREHVEQLVHHEQKLYAKGADLAEADLAELHHLKRELDQCWDLLRQRQALIDNGKDPSKAHVRPIDVVESYEG